MTMNTIQIGPFLGINNKLPDFALHVEGNGDYLRTADNVEITGAGSIVRRKAPSLIQAMAGAHSLHGDLYVRASVLYRATFDPFAESMVRVLTSNARMSFCMINGDMYYSNGTDSGRIAANGSVFPWALPTPTPPAVATTTGTLFSGKYRVAVSYTNSVTGEEGGVSAATSYELAIDGGLRITLPAATLGATHVNVYVSTVNGQIPTLRTTVTAGTATVDVVASGGGREAVERYEIPLPAGTRIFEFNGRLCSVLEKVLYYSIPHRPGYMQADRVEDGRIEFPLNISVAIGNQLGVYVVADKTYFLQGTDLASVELILDVLPYGAVPGTEFDVPTKPEVGWFGECGVVLADTQGKAAGVMEQTIDLEPPVSGFSIVIETRGYSRVVSCGWCLNLDNMAATTYSDWGITSASGDYGTREDGIYLLEDDAPVDAYIDLGKQNFGSEYLKKLLAGYLSVASPTPMLLRVTVPNGAEYDYLARGSDENLVVQRIDTGKGLRETYFGMKIYNTEGSDFTLAAASFAPVDSGRRI